MFWCDSLNYTYKMVFWIFKYSKHVWLLSGRNPHIILKPFICEQNIIIFSISVVNLKSLFECAHLWNGILGKSFLSENQGVLSVFQVLKYHNFDSHSTLISQSVQSLSRSGLIIYGQSVWLGAYWVKKFSIDLDGSKN